MGDNEQFDFKWNDFKWKQLKLFLPKMNFLICKYGPWPQLGVQGIINLWMRKLPPELQSLRVNSSGSSFYLERYRCFCCTLGRGNWYEKTPNIYLATTVTVDGFRETKICKKWPFPYNIYNKVTGWGEDRDI